MIVPVALTQRSDLRRLRRRLPRPQAQRIQCLSLSGDEPLLKGIFIATATGVAVANLLPAAVTSHTGTRFLVAWNAATILYVVLAAVMMARSSEHNMRHRAKLQDDGQLLILVLVVVSSVASLTAIAGQLSVVKDMHGFLKTAHIALAGVTVVSSWAFIQVMFATVARHAVLSIDPAISRRSACGLRQHSRQPTPSPDFTAHTLMLWS